MFEIVDDGRRTTDADGRTPEHGYTISSPCEPNGSGELKIHNHSIHSKAGSSSMEAGAKITVLNSLQ